jgi:hypothetical protein
MRRLFLLLLVANALCAGWILLSPRESTGGGAPRPAAPVYAAKLQLVSEYSRAAEDFTSPSPQAPAVEAAGIPGAAPVGTAAATPPAVPGADAGAGVQGPGETVPPEDGDEQPDGAGATKAPESAAVVVAPARECVRIGPLRDGAAGERMQQRVREWLPAARLEEGEAPDRSSYWVHVPPRASDDEARGVVRALAARGVDSFVIRDEPALLHGVSLGVFREAESAQELVDRMQGIGYPVAIHEKARIRRAVFLRGALGADAGAAVPPALGEAVAGVAPEARVAPAGCDGIAPATGSD